MSSGRVAGALGAAWSVLGLSLILGRGFFALCPHVQKLSDTELEWFHWSAMAVWIVFMGYLKGLRAFHRNFSPRAAARLLYLKQNPTVLRVLLAPLFCMGYFHATRKRMILSWSLTAGIICLIILVGRLDQPWRGIIDAGVLFGLGWGLVSFWLFAIKVLAGKGVDISPETPEA